MMEISTCMTAAAAAAAAVAVSAKWELALSGWAGGGHVQPLREESQSAAAAAAAPMGWNGCCCAHLTVQSVDPECTALCSARGGGGGGGLSFPSFFCRTIGHISCTSREGRREGKKGGRPHLVHWQDELFPRAN